MHSAHEKKKEGSSVNGSWLPTRQEDECGLDADCAVETSGLFISSKVLCAALHYKIAATLMFIHCYIAGRLLYNTKQNLVGDLSLGFII